MASEIPTIEFEWLYGLDGKYKIEVGNSSANTVFPVDILPPYLVKWVKKNYRYSEYVNFGPSMGTPTGMQWSIWGWDSLPNESAPTNAAWHTFIESRNH